MGVAFGHLVRIRDSDSNGGFRLAAIQITNEIVSDRLHITVIESSNEDEGCLHALRRHHRLNDIYCFIRERSASHPK